MRGGDSTVFTVIMITVETLSTQTKQHNITLFSHNTILTSPSVFQDLMNSSYEKPHDPYIQLQTNHWPPYVELLLRCGIAQRHKEDCNLLRLVPFHM